MERRSFLTACGLALTSTAGCLGAGGNIRGDIAGDPIPAGPTVGLEPVIQGPVEDAGTGPRFPVDLVTSAGGDHWYVADRYGTIWYRGPDGLAAEPALDLRDRVLTNGEQGLLGLALHPDFPATGTVYVRYSGPPTPDTPDDYSHTARLSAFRVGDDPASIRRGSERPILALDQPGTHHNGGAVTVGPDGLLYASFGSGEWLPVPDARDPRQATDWYEWTDGGNGQDVTENLLGSVLRIDVDGREAGKPYAIPDDNPLVGDEGLDEQFAWGFRNPWKMGFSRGDLYVADVGAYNFEEVDRVRAGGNYGWKVREGTSCFNGRHPSIPGPWCPDETPDGEPLVPPVIEYPHLVRTDEGVENRYSAVVGGYIYENGTVPSLTGRYVFGDFSGHLLVATPSDGEGQWPVRRLSVDGGLPGIPLGFARDASGELLVATVGQRGRVDRLVPAGSTASAVSGTTGPAGGDAGGN